MNQFMRSYASSKGSGEPARLQKILRALTPKNRNEDAYLDLRVHGPRQVTMHPTEGSLGVVYYCSVDTPD